MAFDIILFVAGIIIAVVTLRDVFETVIVPGGSLAMLQVAQRVVIILLPLWKLARGKRRGLSSTFAPLVLVICFTIWMTFLTVGFALMAYALRAEFHHPLRNFSDALYLVGSSLATVGLSSTHPEGNARWVIIAAGFCGLAVMTMAVTYLLEVQNSIARRDTGIIKLNTSAGNPPSAVTLLERFAAIRNQAELSEVLREGRNWCATVRQSHSAHPSLIYFQSISTGAGWPAALGALLDCALLTQYCIDDDSLYGPAILLGQEGLRMARDLATLVRLEPVEATTSAAELEQTARDLAASGYKLRPSPDFPAMATERKEYLGWVQALAQHLGKPDAVLVRR